MAIKLNDIIEVLEKQIPGVSKHISFELKDESDIIDTPTGTIMGKRKVMLYITINMFEIVSVNTLKTILNTLRYCGLPDMKTSASAYNKYFVYSLDVTDKRVYYIENNLCN